MLQFDCRDHSVARQRLPWSHAQAGESIVDVGSGLGHLTVELSRAVGDTGNVIGVDPSVDMRKAAASQCDGLTNVRILDGTATALPLDDESADRAASLQVFEYLSDIPGALAEIRRVLRPGGRLVVGDMHFGTAGSGTATSPSAWRR
jgi:arsenite methyltransferase